MDTTCHHLAAIWQLSTERISTLKTAFGHCLSTVLSEGCYYDDLIVSWKWLFPRQPSLIADCDLKDAIWAIRGELTGLKAKYPIWHLIGNLQEDLALDFAMNLIEMVPLAGWAEWFCYFQLSKFSCQQPYPIFIGPKTLSVTFGICFKLLDLSK